MFAESEQDIHVNKLGEAYYCGRMIAAPDDNGNPDFPVIVRATGRTSGRRTTTGTWNFTRWTVKRWEVWYEHHEAHTGTVAY